MNDVEIDSAEVLHSYGQALAEKPKATCDEALLPFPKSVIKSTIAYYLRQRNDEQTIRHLELAYLLLADFQQISDDEWQSMEVMETLQDTSDMSDREVQQLASHLADTGPVYHALQNRIWQESEQLQQELRSLRLQ